MLFLNKFRGSFETLSYFLIFLPFFSLVFVFLSGTVVCFYYSSDYSKEMKKTMFCFVIFSILLFGKKNFLFFITIKKKIKEYAQKISSLEYNEWVFFVLKTQYTDSIDKKQKEIKKVTKQLYGQKLVIDSFISRKKEKHVTIKEAEEEGDKMFRFLTNKDFLVIEDLKNVFGSKTEEVFRFFDRLSNSNVTKKELSTLYYETRREFIFLKKEIEVYLQLKKKLEIFLLLLVFLIQTSVVFSLLTSEETIKTKQIVSSAAVFISLSTVLSETIKTIISSLIFLFVTSPYDIEDRILIYDLDEKDESKPLYKRIDLNSTSFFPVEINFFSTRFRKWDGQEIIISNQTLAKKTICNIKRSGGYIQRTKISFTNASFELTSKFYTKMLSFLDRRDFSSLIIAIDEIKENNEICFSIFIKHKLNYQNVAERARRLNHFFCLLKKHIKETGVEYNFVTRNISLSVSDFLYHETDLREQNEF